MATTEERLPAHDATLAQMNERLGNIEARLREMNTRFDARFDSIQTQLAHKADRDFVLKLTGGLGPWVTLLIGFQTLFIR